MQTPAITSLPPPALPGTTGPRNHSLIPASPNSDNSESAVNQSKENQAGSSELSERERRQLAELKKIDREVRAHEAAHMAAAGGLARGGASFSYTQGPDGQRYAVSGEVSIDTSAVRGDPEATLLKAQRILAAALAPAQPSSADRAVAASAAQMAASARAELLAQRLEPETHEQQAKDANDVQAIDNKETTNTDNTSNRETQAHAGTALTQLIRQATSAENRLGNLLDTAV